ncbi:hypothetical protein TFLX_03859 [Thermoflexales bacterium]|nr:hypothetical protein TFLX_03859 [Thermoflexales bacterium]
MTKDELIKQIESEWANLQAALEGLTEEQMHQPGVVGEWTIKDVLAHITAWQTRLITTLFKAEKGITPETTAGGKTVDQMNERFHQELKDRPFDQVWDDLDSSHYQLLNRLESWKEKDLFDPKRFKWMQGKPFVEYIAGDSYEHYEEHAAQIRAWRKTMTNDQ